MVTHRCAGIITLRPAGRKLPTVGVFKLVCAYWGKRKRGGAGRRIPLNHPAV